MTAPFERLLDALPQTQCTRCGLPDCAGYAAAIANREAPINRCPPGGAEGIARLARLTSLPVEALDPEFGIEGPRALAVIDEAWCIGCTKCLDACPTDAILGLHKRMHSVVEAHCTGCELCVPVCPVDCIAMEIATPGRTGWDAWSEPQAAHARDRYEMRKTRLARKRPHPESSPAFAAAPQRLSPGTAALPSAELTPIVAQDAAAEAEALAKERKRAIVEAALARARAAAASRKTPS
ncbi:Ion-translocating oxidoreductase complex subunit B [Burkholderiales bacterium 8X]|nr:Ion-translocating oxidoreductase complex subunit B [Burkholderiales bacterium 8X]